MPAYIASQSFTVIGGVKLLNFGTFAQYLVVERSQVIRTPDHVDDVHAAAWPLGAVTAWRCAPTQTSQPQLSHPALRNRAAIVNGAVKKGDNVLITGIGGGVALLVLQICLAQGANVYVTSGSEDKIHKAIELGAKGGVSYKASMSSRPPRTRCMAYPHDRVQRTGRLSLGR